VVVACFEIISRHLAEETEENNENHARILVSLSRLEPDTAQVQFRSVPTKANLLDRSVVELYGFASREFLYLNKENLHVNIRKCTPVLYCGEFPWKQRHIYL
jgi:cyclophilin family peptidyl-prolyl cis-trans isomerase